MNPGNSGLVSLRVGKFPSAELRAISRFQLPWEDGPVDKRQHIICSPLWLSLSVILFPFECGGGVEPNWKLSIKIDEIGGGSHN